MTDDEKNVYNLENMKHRYCDCPSAKFIPKKNVFPNSKIIFNMVIA